MASFSQKTAARYPVAFRLVHAALPNFIPESRDFLRKGLHHKLILITEFSAMRLFVDNTVAGQQDYAMQAACEDLNCLGFKAGLKTSYW